MSAGEAVQDRKLFVGGLAGSTDDEGLKEYFSKWGEIVDVVVMKDNQTGRSRGFGFVTYIDSSMAEKAVADGPHTIDGKTTDTKRAVSKDAMDDKSAGPTDKVFIGGLSKEITNTQLREYFEQFGAVKEASVMTDKETGESRCFAFVVFTDFATVDKVMQSKPHNLQDCQIDVQKAVARDQMKKRGGNFNRRPMGGPSQQRYDYSRNRGSGGNYSDSYYDRGYGGGPGYGYYPPQDQYYGGGYYDQGYYGGGGYGDYGHQDYGSAGPMRSHYPAGGAGPGYSGGRSAGGRPHAPPKSRGTPYGRP